jgi:GTPase-associated protein 1, N-terminal domain type 2/GTPase-associated protein 1, middle domain
MAFQQLYYTSCEHGLAGYSGYQFNAVTPGVAPVVMREVEDRTVYEPPGWLLATPRPDDPEAYPVAFCHGMSVATGTVITAQVVFAGIDYSGRPGNYFAHALVTDTPEQDFGPLLPVELWGAELWQRHPAERTELPELRGPPLPGRIDRAGTQAFLDAHGAGLLPQLLTAVGKAMDGDRPVLLANHDVTENAWWIAAVCYLLGDQLGRRLTFTTYSHRPAYSPYHLTGVLPEALPPDAGASFQLFDLTAGRVPTGRVHPLAALLSDAGVMAAPGLWQQAAAFGPGAGTGPGTRLAAGTGSGRDTGTGRGESLDDWLAPMTAAAGLLGRELSPGETDMVAGWLLATAGAMPVPLADAGLSVTLSQPAGALSDQRLLDLLGLARQLPSADQAGRLESLLSERALTRLARGEPALPVGLTGPAASAARARAVQVLARAGPATALAVLAWAAACGLALPEPGLERYGRTRLDPGTPEPDLSSLLSGYPAIRRGLLARLAGAPPQVAEALFAGPAGACIGRDDLARYPGLAELWLIRAAAKGDIEPLRAFDEISDIRAGRPGMPRADGELLHRLWPDGCPAEQIAELLAAVTERPAADVLAWFAREIGAVVARGRLDAGSLRLARALTGHPVLPALPEADQQVMRNAARVEPLLRLAKAAGRHLDLAIFADFYATYATVDDESRHLLETELPPLLAAADPLGTALRGCPPGIAAAFCRALTPWLAASRADGRLARRIFVALGDPDVRAHPLFTEWLLAAFEPVREWRRRDLATLARNLANDGLAEQFQDWKDEQRTGLARKVFGAGREPLADRRREEA